MLKFREFGSITAALRSFMKLCLRELKANGVCLKLVIQRDLHVVHEVSLAACETIFTPHAFHSL
jgi:hypothetical protein